MFETTTGRDRSPLSSASTVRRRIPTDAARGSKPAKASFHHSVKFPRLQGGRSNVDPTKNPKSLDLLLNGRIMEQLLTKKFGATSQAFVRRGALRRYEEERDEVTSSTPRIPDTNGGRRGEEGSPVEETRQMESSEGYETGYESTAVFVETDQRGPWVTASGCPTTNSSVLGAKPAVEPMDFHVAGNNDAFGNVSAITNDVRPLVNYEEIGEVPDYGSFYRTTCLAPAPAPAPAPVIPLYSDTHYRRPRKPQVEKPVVEYGRTGTVANYNCSEGFGFITVNSVVGKMAIVGNLFVHHSSLQQPSLTKGMEVKFDVGQGQRGYEAINVSFISDTIE